MNAAHGPQVRFQKLAKYGGYLQSNLQAEYLCTPRRLIHSANRLKLGF